MARATVIDGDSALLIERGRGLDIGEWFLAGGYLEYDESPREGAARELGEETGLSVSPTDLTLIGDGFLDAGNGLTMVSFNYAASKVAAEGTLQADDDAAAARFWSRDELKTNAPALRASGLQQLLTAIDELGR
ncbi:NUDIX hydrolase [Natrarchaeobius halalkaliphilus]|uniref:NUDIX hydrolase n=1 Tax=Natrarchaeobius halalkaliphilus TaxID=1679091 RepID=A0A3N6MWZ7_9EURY|nr:NUDIX hydrolase [Natrarchaeobius halalkaliphilus]RQG90012.1 NUDIX hydrolase [Natrarchaeobius halalkaliphilus]